MAYGNSPSYPLLLKLELTAMPLFVFFFFLPYGNFTSQKCSLILPNPSRATLLCLSLPYTSLPYPTLPTLPCPILRYPPYCTLPHPTIPYPTLSYLGLPHMHVSFNPGRESNAGLYVPKNPSWRLASTHRRISVHYRNRLSSSAASPRDLSSDDSVPAGTSKLSRSRFARSANRKEVEENKKRAPITVARQTCKLGSEKV